METGCSSWLIERGVLEGVEEGVGGS